MLMTGNPSLPELMVQQESANLMNQTRQLENKKMAQEYQNKQQLQSTLQRIYTQKQQQQQPVSDKTQLQLAKQSGMVQEQQYIKSLQDDYDTNMAIANEVMKFDPKTADEYIKMAKASRQAASDYAKEQRLSQKEEVKEIGGHLNGMYQSQEGYQAGLQWLQENKPELAEKIYKKYGPVLTEQAAREINAMADQSMTVEQQQAKELARQKFIEDRQHKQEAADERKRMDNERIREFQLRREEVKSNKAERETKVDKANKLFVKTENDLTYKYNKQYDSLHKEYKTAKLAYDKLDEKSKSSDEGKALLEEIQSIHDRQVEATSQFEDDMNKARGDAMIEGATHPRVEQPYRAHTTDKPELRKDYPNAPKIGTVIGGYTYIGGDPSKEESWKKQ